MEVDNFLSLAESRNKLIPHLIATDQVHLSPGPFKQALMRGMMRLAVFHTEVEGAANLEEAIKLSANYPLIVVSNHQADVDHALKRHILENISGDEGFQQLADRLVYPAGLKMHERPYVRFFMGAEHSVYVLTPFDIRVLLEMKRNQSLTPGQKEVVQKYWQNCKLLSAQSKSIMDQLVSEGKIVSLYPESTRSRHPQGLLQRAPQEIGVHFQNHPDGFILPMVVTGITGTFPVGERPRLQRSSVKMVVGKPYPVEKILSADLSQPTGGERVTRADLVMAKIATLNPDLVDPKHRVLYDPLKY